MISPYGTERKCATLPVEELEETFFYPGPNVVRDKPRPAVQEQWDKAKETCIECPVFVQCRERCWGEEYGVVGGTDQYERYLYRRRRQAWYKRLDDVQKQALKNLVYSRTGRRSLEAISGETGLPVGQIRSMLKERQNALDEARKAAAAAARDAVGWTPTVVWPKGHPEMGDGWLWREGEVHQGHYVSQTRDGSWVRMKFRARKTPVIRWFPAAHVDLRTQVVPVYAERSGTVSSGVRAESSDNREPAAA